MVNDFFVEAVLDGVGVVICLEDDEVIDEGGIVSIEAGASTVEDDVAAEGGTQQLGDSLLKENLIDVEFGQRLPQRHFK